MSLSKNDKNEVITFLDKMDLDLNINSSQINKIKSRLPEYIHASKKIGHSHSQSQYALLTLNLISDSPLSRMKQCVTQIHHKYNALQEAYYKIKYLKEESKTCQYSIRRDEIASQINGFSVSMSSALREIGLFQDMYESLRKNNNISEEWTEGDYEDQEVPRMIRSCFRLAIQNLMSHDHLSQSCVEYAEQLGIHPYVIWSESEKYFKDIESRQSGLVDITHLYNFYDQMVNKYGNEYKKALRRMGLNELGSKEFLAEIIKRDMR